MAQRSLRLAGGHEFLSELFFKLSNPLLQLLPSFIGLIELLNRYLSPNLKFLLRSERLLGIAQSLFFGFDRSLQLLSCLG